MNSFNLAHDAVNLPSIVAVAFTETMMAVSLSDGRIINVPLAWYARLATATKVQREHYEISPGAYGIHWPDLDEDLSVKGFLLP